MHLRLQQCYRIAAESVLNKFNIRCLLSSYLLIKLIINIFFYTLTAQVFPLIVHLLTIQPLAPDPSCSPSSISAQSKSISPPVVLKSSPIESVRAGVGKIERRVFTRSWAFEEVLFYALFNVLV